MLDLPDSLYETRGDIIISGRDKAFCDLLKEVLAPVWNQFEILWLPTALKTLNYLWVNKERKPAIVVIMVVGLDRQQIELVQELAVVHEEGERPLVLVVADCNRDEVLLGFLRLSGADMVVDVEDFSTHLQDIKALADNYVVVD